LRNNVSHLPKEPKAFVIRKTRQIPFIDQLIAETLLFQSCGVYTSCLEQLRMTFPCIE